VTYSHALILRFALMFMAAPVFMAALPTHAQTYPQPSTGDIRIQTVEYDPLRIIRLSVAPGIQTMVELASGENIQTIGVGDSAAWQVSAGKRGDFFFVKNVNANAITNMSVVTASRVYNFELAPAGAYGDVSPYHVKVVYPARSQSTEPTTIAPEFEYKLSGAKSIRPSSVVQEGMRTVLEWPEEAALPGIFMLQNGNEALVNGEMQEGRFVIPGTPEKLIFRLDRQTAYATRKAIKAVPNE
jgi:type IV secretion system protein VirB9